MKKSIIILMSAVCISTTGFSQNTNPWPSSGAIGIGTSSPGTGTSLDVKNGIIGQSNGPSDRTLFLSSHSVSYNRVGVLGINTYWDGGGYTVPDNTNNAAAIEIHRGIGAVRFLDISTGGTATASHSFGLGSNSSFLNASGGYVGIGSSSTPAEMLDVNGNIKIANNGYLKSATNTHIEAGTSSYIGFNTNGAERMKILSDGTVGIGTNITSATSGAYKLLVDGKIGAREIKVTATTVWPDYVFAKEYNLISLTALEQFIKQNKHLPNMPSAEEVKKEGGVNLGEMNAKLLEKIEELTLYMIQLKKENEEIKKKLDTILNKKD